MFTGTQHMRLTSAPVLALGLALAVRRPFGLRHATARRPPSHRIALT